MKSRSPFSPRNIYAYGHQNTSAPTSYTLKMVFYTTNHLPVSLSLIQSPHEREIHNHSVTSLIVFCFYGAVLSTKFYNVADLSIAVGLCNKLQQQYFNLKFPPSHQLSLILPFTVIFSSGSYIGFSPRSPRGSSRKSQNILREYCEERNLLILHRRLQLTTDRVSLQDFTLKPLCLTDSWKQRMILIRSDRARQHALNTCVLERAASAASCSSTLPFHLFG